MPCCFSFRDQHVLITGGSSGIGRSVAALVLEEGARVTIVARNRDRLAQAVEELATAAGGDSGPSAAKSITDQKSNSKSKSKKSSSKSASKSASKSGDSEGAETEPVRNKRSYGSISTTTSGDRGSDSGDDHKEDEGSLESRSMVGKGSRIQFVVADVTDEAGTRAAIDDAVSRFGPVDVLVTSAGTSFPASFEDTPASVFESLMRLNLMGTVHAVRAVLPSMKERKKGRLVFVSSLAGLVGVYGYTAYSASKFALRGFAEALQMEVKPYKIGVTLNCPPDTDTPLFAEENKMKPVECNRISEGSGLFTSHQVAKDIVNGVKSGLFLCSSGFSGTALCHLSSAMAPQPSFWGKLVELAGLPILRIVALFELRRANSIVSEEFKKKQRISK